MASGDINLFTYGTLCLTEIMQRVTGRRWPSSPARLEGYERFLLRGHAYPGMVHTGRSSTLGRVWFGIDPPALRHIDAFEGGYYRRESVTVRLEDGEGDGEPVEAVAYVLVDAMRYLLSGHEWDEALFRRRHLPRYLRRRLDL